MRINVKNFIPLAVLPGLIGLVIIYIMQVHIDHHISEHHKFKDAIIDLKKSLLKEETIFRTLLSKRVPDEFFYKENSRIKGDIERIREEITDNIQKFTDVGHEIKLKSLIQKVKENNKDIDNIFSRYLSLIKHLGKDEWGLVGELKKNEEALFNNEKRSSIEYVELVRLVNNVIESPVPIHYERAVDLFDELGSDEKLLNYRKSLSKFYELSSELNRFERDRARLMLDSSLTLENLNNIHNLHHSNYTLIYNFYKAGIILFFLGITVVCALLFNRTFLSIISNLTKRTENSGLSEEENVGESIDPSFDELTQGITELKKRNIEREAQLEKQSVYTTLGEMSASISHEINNPLAIVKAQNDFLVKIANKDRIEKSDIIKRTDAISRAYDRIYSVISSIKKLVKSSSKNDYSIFSLNEILLPMRFLLGPKLNESEIELIVDGDADGENFFGNEVLLGQVLLNLVNNSYQSIKKRNGKKWIEVKIKTSNKSVFLFVTDCGEGIPEEIRKKLFSENITTKAKGEGTGLGLKFCCRVISSHGGSIWIDEECENTRFVIELPKKAAKLSSLAA